MASKITYWSLTTYELFRGNNVIEAMRITNVNLTLTGAEITYQTGWLLRDKDGVVVDMFCPGIDRRLDWEGPSYAVEAAKVPLARLTRRQDLISLFYRKLAESDPSLSGTLVLADI